MYRSVWTIHQAKFVDGRFSEMVVMCRDEPEPPVFFYEETVMTVEQVISYMIQGDLFYAQWGENCLNIEIITLANGDESVEVVPHAFGEAYGSLAKLPFDEYAFSDAFCY
jgi:hypothetical protein